MFQVTHAVGQDVRNIGAHLSYSTQKKNKLKQLRLNALVFVKYNLRLELRQREKEQKGNNNDHACRICTPVMSG